MKYADLIRAILAGKRLQYQIPAQKNRPWYTIESPHEAIRMLLHEEEGYNFREEPPPPPADIVRYCNRYPYEGYTTRDAADRGASRLRLGVEKVVYDGVTGKVKSVELVTE